MKTKQCFCQSIYNGETKQVENCACGKCSLAINPVPTQMTSNEEKIEKIIDEFFVVDGKEHNTRELKDKFIAFLHSQKERVVEMCVDECLTYLENPTYELRDKIISDLKTKIEEKK